ncbi:MAG: YfiR family protein [Candidatus Parabeggiatoa sp.]|nr:YfiR family protein [Candidatus Parabeggiatoa sp.]
MWFQQKKTKRVISDQWKWGITLCLLTVLIGSLTYAAVLLTPKEYQVKAVYLFNFSKFINWPASAFDNSRTPIRICVLGKNPFEDFDRLVKGKKVQKRRITVEHLSDYRQANRCHILFVSKSEKGNQAAILAYTQQYPILTVSDIRNFVVRGGMIQFYIRGRKVRFMIDPDTVQEAGIRASANLLRVAKIVR